MSQKTQTTVSNQDILQAIQAMDNKFTVANDDILSAVSTSFTAVETELFEIKDRLGGVEGRLDHVTNRLGSVEDRLEGVEDRLGGVDGRLDHVENRLGSVENKMVTKEEFKQEMVKVVTKEYLDDKLSDLKGNLVGLVRKEDHKVDTVVTILHDHKVLTGQDLEQINQVGLFPKTKAKMTVA